MSRILGWKVADARTSGMLYKAFVRAILLFSLETWVMTPRIGRTLGGFRLRVTRRLEGMQPQRDMEGRW